MKKDIKTSNSLRKFAFTALIAAPALIVPSVHALPTTLASNLTVSNGTAAFGVSADAKTLTITASNKTILTWGAFGDVASSNGINTGETVNYVIGAGSSVLNRVKGTTATTIAGSITSDGSVYLLNPNGITIAPGGASDKVSTQGFYASTVQEPDSYFTTNGTLSFVGSSAAAITVTGNGANKVIAGAATLVGKNVTVSGVLEALTVTSTGVDADSVKVAAAGLTSKALTITAQNGGVTVAGAVTASDNVTISGGTYTTSATVSASGKSISLTTSDAVGTNLTAANFVADNLTVTTASDKNLYLSGDIKKLVTTGQDTVWTANAGTNDLTLGAISAKSLTVVSLGAIKANGSDLVSTNKSSNVSLTAAGDITYNAAGAVQFSVLNSNGNNVSVSSKGNLVVTGAVTTGAGKAISLTAVGGDIVDSAAITTVGKLTISTDKSAKLDGANTAASVVFIGGAGDDQGLAGTTGILYNSAAAVSVAKGTASTGAVKITSSGDVSFGAVGDTIAFGGDLTIVNSGAAQVVAGSDLLTVAGVVDITTNNANAAIGAVNTTNNSISGNSFGAIKAQLGTGSLTVIENAGTNLGKINAAAVTVTNKVGGISNSGVITATTVNVNSPEAVVLDQANAIGTLEINKAASVTLKNGVDTVIHANTAIAGLVSVDVGANALTATTVGADSDYSSFSFTAKGGSAKAISITDNKNGLTLVNSSYTSSSAANDGLITVDAGSSAALTLGAGINLGGKNAAVNAVEFKGKGINDSADGVSIFGNVKFTSTNGITLDNAGHSFGTVTVASTGAAALITENGKLVTAAVSTGGKDLTLVSSTGDIDASGAVINTAAGNLTLKAAAGKVTATAVNTVTGNVSVIANGDSAVTTSAAASLGNVQVAAGKFTVISTGAITQTSGSSVNVYGNSSFTSGGNAITLANSNNNFGGLTLNAGAAAVSLKEYNTINLLSVASTDLTLVSETNGVIDAAAVADGSTSIASSGVATLTASNGAISLLNKTNAFATVAINTTGDAALVDGAGDLLVASSTSKGLSLKTAGKISQSSLITTTGLTSFEAGTIELSDGRNSFGDILVKAGATDIVENAALSLAAGSKITANATFTAAGDITTVGTGGSTFNGNLTLNAVGKITISNQFFVTNTLTVNASGTKDLSFLSLAGNLNGNKPVNQGTGSYVAPTP